MTKSEAKFVWGLSPFILGYLLSRPRFSINNILLAIFVCLLLYICWGLLSYRLYEPKAKGNILTHTLMLNWVTILLFFLTLSLYLLPKENLYHVIYNCSYFFTFPGFSLGSMINDIFIDVMHRDFINMSTTTLILMFLTSLEGADIKHIRSNN